MTYSYGFYFSRPWWLAACVLLVVIVWLGRRSLTTMGPVRRVLAIGLRCLVVLVLIALLARPMLTQTSELLTVITVLDRSQSIPAKLQAQSLAYLNTALTAKNFAKDRLAVVDVAEAASISLLPSIEGKIRERNTTLTGRQTLLSDGIQMAMAIAPPDTAVRILLVSEGNETSGDVKEAARRAAANGIPIDVLALRYRYDREVVFRRLQSPPKARSGQTVPLRLVLESTSDARGKLMLDLNDRPVDLDPASAEIGLPVELKAGTNVQVVSVPVGTRGMHKFEAVFIPDDDSGDVITQNNRASTMTYVAGPGHVLVVDTDGDASKAIIAALQDSEMDVRYIPAGSFPDNPAMVMDTDAIVLVNTDCGQFSYQQQELLVRYVNDLGGGLIMVGGPKAFGAGGWIGSPVAEILPIELDPPQKKQMPKGALVLIMHACEMPDGNAWGKRIAVAAVKALSKHDLVGILAYNWQGSGDWVYPLGQVGDKEAPLSAIRQMIMGDMPSLQDHLQKAYNALIECDAGQKHVIVISDGDPTAPTDKLLSECRDAGITVTGVAISAHDRSYIQRLMRVAQATGGRFYDVTNPSALPQIFIKEAQVVRRALILEETFTPAITYSLSEILRGLSAGLPPLDGYVLTGPKSGLNQTVLARDGDPILATCQAGLGRCVAFTSSADSRWASNWLGWSGFESFWEQVVRWAGKPAQSADCEVFADVQGQDVTVNIEAIDPNGKFMQLAGIDGQVIAPDISKIPLDLVQIGPGQYQGQFRGGASGSYVVNLQYRKMGEAAKTHIMQSTVTIPFAPEFRDLSDNEPLLAEVSKITGGRMLSGDPNMAAVYDKAGVKFPESHRPLTKPLMFVWLVLFLLDVAVRRVVVDFRSIARRAVGVIRAAKREKKADPTIERLKQQRAKLRERLLASKADSLASKRYQASEDYKGGLPVAKASEEAKKESEKKPEKETPKKTDRETSHIDRLLKAKQKTKDRRKDETDADKE
ncbi:MAG: VWA domain-containing protein [Sedimentisphaerales bacterium]|nr:VWA domain-containing protein [Sedimentisphaerales bacterium]